MDGQLTAAATGKALIPSSSGKYCDHESNTTRTGMNGLNPFFIREVLRRGNPGADSAFYRLNPFFIREVLRR